MPKGRRTPEHAGPGVGFQRLDTQSSRPRQHARALFLEIESFLIYSPGIVSHYPRPERRRPANRLLNAFGPASSGCAHPATKRCVLERVPKREVSVKGDPVNGAGQGASGIAWRPGSFPGMAAQLHPAPTGKSKNTS